MTNKHPGINPEHWYGDESVIRPEQSTVDRHEREAELLAGLANRSYSVDVKRVAERLDTIGGGLTWQQLFDMFRSYGPKQKPTVSVKVATMWADRIVERGVPRR